LDGWSRGRRTRNGQRNRQRSS